MSSNYKNKASSSKWVGFFLGPLFFALILVINPENLNPDAWKVIAVAAWMVSWWVSEAAPIPVTALLPIVLFPSLQIFSIGEATAPYASSIIFLFLGGFLIALGLERHKLHERLALNLIKLTGTRPEGIIAGFMLSTALLSMWISNTATALMMLPIAVSVLNLLFHQQESTSANRAFSLCLILGIAYSANIGGMGTIIGTPPNVVLVGFVNQILDYQLAFSNWLLLGIPLVIILLTVTFFILKLIYPYHNMDNLSEAQELLHNRLKGLGKPTRGEKLVITIFSITAFCWIFRNPVNSVLPQPVLNDTLIAMAGGILMFVTPVDLRKREFVLHWENTKELPWGILLLFGGGMVLAKAMEKTEIIQMISEFVAAYDNIPYWVIILIMTAIVIFMTELMSNVALATIMVPVVISMGQGLNIDPLLLAIPVTLASSCAFMLPISTPPNAILFSSGHIRMKEMIRVGIVLNIISVALIVLAATSLVKWLY